MKKNHSKNIIYFMLIFTTVSIFLLSNNLIQDASALSVNATTFIRPVPPAIVGGGSTGSGSGGSVGSGSGGGGGGGGGSGVGYNTNMLQYSASNLTLVIMDWVGYSSHKISNSELLMNIGIKAQYIPTWVLKPAAWVVDNKISEQDFVNIIKYLYEHGMIK